MWVLLCLSYWSRNNLGEHVDYISSNLEALQNALQTNQGLLDSNSLSDVSFGKGSAMALHQFFSFAGCWALYYHISCTPVSIAITCLAHCLVLQRGLPVEQWCRTMDILQLLQVTLLHSLQFLRPRQNEDTLWRQHCWRDHVSQMCPRFAMRATFVSDTKNVSEKLQKHFLWPHVAQQCCLVLPRTGNIAGHSVAATMCPRFSRALQYPWVGVRDWGAGWGATLVLVFEHCSLTSRQVVVLLRIPRPNGLNVAKSGASYSCRSLVKKGA